MRSPRKPFFTCVIVLAVSFVTHSDDDADTALIQRARALRFRGQFEQALTILEPLV